MGRLGRAHRHRPYQSIIFFHAIPHKQNNHLHAIHPNGANRPTRNPSNDINHPTHNPSNDINRSTHNLPKRHQPFHAQSIQAKCVGAAPVCPPERSRSGVSIPKTHIFCAGILTTDAPLWGDSGGHTGTAPTQLHQIFNGCGLSRLNTPKRWADADFHG